MILRSDEKTQEFLDLTYRSQKILRSEKINNKKIKTKQNSYQDNLREKKTFTKVVWERRKLSLKYFTRDFIK